METNLVHNLRSLIQDSNNDKFRGYEDPVFGPEIERTEDDIKLHPAIIQKWGFGNYNGAKLFGLINEHYRLHKQEKTTKKWYDEEPGDAEASAMADEAYNSIED